MSKDANTRDQVQKIARRIDEELPEGWGFILLAFPFEGQEGRLFVSNAVREDARKVIIKWLIKELSENTESRE